MKKFLIALLLALTLFHLASAVVINSVEVDSVAPGEEGTIRIEVENTFSDDVEDVSLLLDFSDLPLAPVGSSQQSVEEIGSDDEEEYFFTFNANPDAAAGNYEVPYTIEYVLDDERQTRTGTIGVQVRANPELSYTISTETPVMGNNGQINLRIINRGFYDARFVTIQVFPEGFTLLSDSEEYIGEIESDDFETASFDVVFTEEDARFVALIRYKNFDNEEIVENVDLPVEVFSREQAIQLGIIQQSSTVYYVFAVIILIIIIVVWRILRRRARRKKLEGR